MRTTASSPCPRAILRWWSSVLSFSGAATAYIYPLSLHDALPICHLHAARRGRVLRQGGHGVGQRQRKSCAHAERERRGEDRKSTRLNSSHLGISYAVFCLKKKRVQHSIRQARGTPGGDRGSCSRRPCALLHHRPALGLSYGGGLACCHSLVRPPPTSTLFPYTTLFRSATFTRLAVDVFSGKAATVLASDSESPAPTLSVKGAVKIGRASCRERV